jgi:hypothetical protein
MPTVQAPVQLSVEHLMTAVKQLPPAELREFTQRIAEWQERDNKQADKEAALMACVRANSALPAAAQRQFNRLRRKHQSGKLTRTEKDELQELWQRVERMNVVRLEALTKLARLRGKDVRTLMRELKLSENLRVF